MRTAELAALERLEKSPLTYNWGKRCHHIFSAIFDLILFIFAGNEDMFKSLYEFEIWPDVTTGFHGNHRVIMGKMLCPL